MNIKAVIAGTALTAAGFVGAGANPVAAGCGVTVELENLTNDSVTVDWEHSEVRTRTGWWKDLDNGSSTIDAGDTLRRNFTLDFGCGADRRYRFDINQDGSSWYEWEPTSTGWTNSTDFYVGIA